MRSIYADCTRRTKERSISSSGIEFIAGCDRIFEALLKASTMTSMWVCFKKEAKIGIWKDYGTDITAVHNEAIKSMISSELYLGALILEKEVA
jgi:hypothetical protein